MASQQNSSAGTSQRAANPPVIDRAAIDRLIRDGMKELTTLDAIMHNKYARNPDKLRAWQSASHIERAPQREKKPSATASTADTSTTQPKAA